MSEPTEPKRLDFTGRTIDGQTKVKEAAALYNASAKRLPELEEKPPQLHIPQLNGRK